MNEKDLQEIAERFKNNTKYMDDDLACCLGSDFGKLIGEVRKLNERETNLRESAEIRGVALEKVEGENQRLMAEIKRLNEKELDEIEKQTKENVEYRYNNIESSYNPPNDLEGDCLDLIAEVRRLNKLEAEYNHSFTFLQQKVERLKEENQRLQQENELIKATRKNIGDD